MWNYDHFYGLVKNETPPLSRLARGRAPLAAPLYRDLGCEHAVLSFYQQPPRPLLARCAAL